MIPNSQLIPPPGDFCMVAGDSCFNCGPKICATDVASCCTTPAPNIPPQGVIQLRFMGWPNGDLLRGGLILCTPVLVICRDTTNIDHPGLLRNDDQDPGCVS